MRFFTAAAKTFLFPLLVLGAISTAAWAADEEKDSGTFVGDAPPTGVLIWRGNNTPHLYGARDLYALVFSEQKACLEASVAMDFKSEPNPFSGLFAALGSKLVDPKAPASDRKAAPLRWHSLSGDSQHSELWIGVAQLAIEVNSVDRLNIQFAAPKSPSKDAPPDECTVDSADKADKADRADSPGNTKYTANYLAANAFFSNSPDSRVGISFALGMTTNPKSTTVTTGDGANQYFNGYAFAKLYIRQPQLPARPEVETESLSARRVSYALVLGTNVTKTSFSEIVVGVSAGHILGNMGVILGLNSLAGAQASSDGRKWRPYLGLEHSF